MTAMPVPVGVFIVDDSVQLTEILSELISDPGIVEVVGSADSVGQAVIDIARLRPDVIILDLQLKDGDGFEVATAVRASPDTRDSAIVFFTNHLSPEFRRRAAELGADLYLDKSKDHDQIVG
ncbi:MAG: response regulator transcription factor, partial [Betaproteobacteria bacterium]